MQARKRARSVKFGNKDNRPLQHEERHPVHQSPAPHHPAPASPVPEETIEVPVEQIHEPVDQPEQTHNPEPQQPEEKDIEASEIFAPREDQEMNEYPSNIDEHLADPADIDQTDIEQHEKILDDQITQLEDQIQPSQDEESYVIEKEVKKSMLGYFILVALIAFLIGLGSMAGANYIYKNMDTSQDIPFLSNLMSTPTPTPAPTRIPTPTEKQIDLSAYGIEVLNGSGITGAAAKLKDSLTTDGFKVINTGNADKSDYTQTVIEASKAIDSTFLSKLKEQLGASYKLGSSSALPSGYSGKADIIIIIGSTTK